MVTVVENGTLIDGTGRAPIERAVVAISDGKVIYAGAASGWSDAGLDITRLDVRGQFVLPGLIDCHVHLSGSGEADSQFRMDTGPMTLKILQNAQKNLAAGITTVRDLGGWNELEFDVRRAIQLGDFPGRACVWRDGLYPSPRLVRIIMRACIALPMVWMKSARRCVNR